MSASLVGSEMCIRDSAMRSNPLFSEESTTTHRRGNHYALRRLPVTPVSYTHLTLPTICSV
eukprot:11283761-Alexandrium_andersonii.AAC.1